MPPLQVAGSLIGIIIVLVGAYFATYYIGLKASGQQRRKSKSRSKSRSIKLLERFSISKDKSFCIVEIAGKVYVVGVANLSMTLLDTLDAADFYEATECNDEAPSRNAAQGGGPFSGRFLKSVAGFMNINVGKKGARESKRKSENMGASFADTLKSAQDKNSSSKSNISGQETIIGTTELESESTERINGSEVEK